MSEPARPWYFESSQGAYVNEWTWTHALWGAALYHYTRSIPLTMILHTLYEIIEKDIFPVESRDTSLANHVGDSLAALSGAGLVQYSRRVL